LLDWLAYDAIEPLNAGDLILLRLFGRKEQPDPPPQEQNEAWERFKHSMKMHMLITGRKRKPHA
jgi:hypothetical protein